MAPSLQITRLSLALAATLAACGGGDGGTTPTPVAAGFTVALSSSTLTVEQGSSGSITATIARTGSFAGTVNLSTESVPTGITASFTPSAVTTGTTATTLAVTVAASVVPGAYSFTIRGQGAGIADQKTAVVAMTVTARPAIAMTLAPTSASVVQGGTTSFAATIARTNFAGAVVVAITGAPAGVTAAVTTVGDVHTAALAVGATTVPGTYTLTATATGTGVTSVTATFALTVTALPASISMVASPGTVTVQAGGAAQSSTVSITRTNFTGAVTLSASGAPAGVTTAIVTSPTTTNSIAVTFTASAATAPGTYPITLQGSGTGITSVSTTVSLVVTAANAGSIALSANPATVSAAAGGGASSRAILITRVGFPGPVAFTASGAPSGVTTSFTTSPTTAGSVTVSFTASLTAVPGTYPVTITATGSGVADATLQIALTITPPPGITLSLSVNPVVVQQGTSGSTTVNIARNNFASAVAFSVSGLPSGVTGSFTTTSVTTNSNTLTLAVAAVVPVGSYPGITITATGFGIVNATVVLTLNVTPASGGGNVSYSFCGQSSIIPIWFAAQSGASGPWTQVAPGSNNTYTFTIASIGGVAWVTQNAVNDYDLTIVYGTQAELGAQGPGNCLTPVLKTVTGTAAGFGLTNSDFVSVSLGTATASPAPTFALPGFTIANVPDGLRDLMGTRSSLGVGGFTLNRLFLKRGLNPGNGASVGTVDFGNATDAFDPITQSVTVSGAAVNEQVIATAAFMTGNGSTVSLGTSIGLTSTFNFFAVPAARTIAGDVHTLSAFAGVISGSTVVARTVTTAFRNPANQTVTFGAALSVPTVTVLTNTPYVRLRTQFARQSEYQDLWVLAYSQDARNVTTQMSAGYLGSATTIDLSVPDFTLVGGWMNTWGLQPGVSLQHTTTANGWVLGNGGFTDGALIRTGYRTNTIPNP